MNDESTVFIHSYFSLETVFRLLRAGYVERIDEAYLERFGVEVTTILDLRWMNFRTTPTNNSKMSASQYDFLVAFTAGFLAAFFSPTVAQ